MTKQLLLLALLLLVPSSLGTIMYVEAAAGGGAQWYDDFASANNNDVDAGCGSRTCSIGTTWEEYEAAAGNTAIDTNRLYISSTAYQLAYIGDSTDTASQYVGFTRLANTGGALARYDHSAFCGYLLYPYTGTIKIFAAYTNRGGTPAIAEVGSLPNTFWSLDPWVNGDGFGLTVTGTGNSTYFTVYVFDASTDSGVPPIDFADWASAADETGTICASGCDAGFTTAPESITVCSGGPAGAGTKIGLMNPEGTYTYYDYFRGGDFTP